MNPDARSRTGLVALALAAALAPAAAAAAARAGRPAAPAPAPAPSLDRAALLESLRVEHQSFELSNGLRVIVHTDPSVPVVAVNLWYHVGSRDEKRGRTGFAHLFEHFFFNGSEHHPSGFREAMDDLGATNRNGTTSNDRTNFFEDVPVAALEKTLFLEADRMGFLAARINQEMLERERGVVQNEKRQGENQPYGRTFSRAAEMLYPASHPYSWPVIGSMEDLEAASLADVQAWYKTYYGPNNCVLALAGDITVERARELAQRYFGDIPPGPALPRLEAWVPRLERDIRDVIEDRVPQPRIYRMWHLPGWGDPDTLRLQLGGNVLTGSKNARLEKRLVYEKELATEVGAFVWEKQLASVLVVFATAKPGVEPAAVERELDAALRDFVERGPTAAELERAKTRIFAETARGLERLGGFQGRSDLLAEGMTFGGDPHAYLAHLRRMQESSPADVTTAAKRWLGAGEHHYTLWVQPAASASAAPSALDRSQVPGTGGAPETIGFPSIARARLANGLEILLLPREGAPLVQVALAVDAGWAADPTEKAGLASLTLGLLDDGTATRDAFRISEELEALGAEISTDGILDLSFVRLKALEPALPASLDVFADVILHPAFPDDLFRLEKDRRLARIAQERANPNASALRVIPGLLFGAGHPYGKPASGSGHVETVGAIERADLVAWHAAWFRPERATLIVTGATTLDELMPAVERAFGGWRAAGPPPVKPPLTMPERAPKPGTIFLIDKPDATQSVIVAAHASLPGGQPDDLAMETVMRLYGGMATSRLNRNLRLDKHWSYGTSGFLADARGPRPWITLAPVQTDKTRESMLEVWKEIRGIAGERPIQGEEFVNIQRGTAARLPGRFETLNALEEAAIDLVNFGYSDDWFRDMARNVKRQSEAELAAAAARFLRPAEVFWLVVGDRRRIEAGLAALGWGEVVPLDADGRPLPAP